VYYLLKIEDTCTFHLQKTRHMFVPNVRETGIYNTTMCWRECRIVVRVIMSGDRRSGREIRQLIGK
jgi:hypothetical protein